MEDLLASPHTRLVSINPELRQRELELYSSRAAKTRGLVDCASFVVMEQEGIAEAFTTDRHFEQAGFECLLPWTAAQVCPSHKPPLLTELQSGDRHRLEGAESF
ncbi:MAG: hypothetical protein RMK20_01075 [Verrucomicrobiales bacterium]|nr:hypothetical protein [Verrucomicrobiales bacterium]